MTELIRILLVGPTPNWVSAVLILAVVIVFARQVSMAQRVSRHARSIANMDAWADATDERLERIDWIKQRQRAANDSPAPETRHHRARRRMTA